MNEQLQQYLNELEAEKCPSAPAAEEAAIQRQLDPVINLLTSSDEATRRTAVMRLNSHAIPEVSSRLIDRLIGLLRSRTERVSARAAASLVDIGLMALPSLRHALFTTSSAAVQVYVVEILSRIGCSLPPQKRVRIQGDLDIALASFRSQAVVNAILEAQDTLNPAYQRNG